MLQHLKNAKKIPLLLLGHWSFTNSFCPSKIPFFILSPIFFCPWWREKEVFQGNHSSPSLRHELVVQSLLALPSLCGTGTKPKRQILKANPKAETVWATNCGWRWSFVKLCGWKSSTRALLCCSLLVKEKAENKWGCSRKMWDGIFYKSIYKYMLFFFLLQLY